MTPSEAFAAGCRVLSRLEVDLNASRKYADVQIPVIPQAAELKLRYLDEVMDPGRITSRYAVLSTLFSAGVLRHHSQLDQACLLHLAKLARDMGCFSLGIEVAHALTTQFPDNRRMRMEACLVSAKCNRGLGYYEQALGQYRSYIADAVQESSQRDVAYGLMMIGKMADNYLWRMGHHYQFLKIALGRFQKIRRDDYSPKLARNLAICLDSLAKAEFDLYLEQHQKPPSGEHLAKILSRFDMAEDLHREENDAPRRPRVRARRLCILFEAEPHRREQIASDFHRELEVLEGSDGELRGMAVRYQQYATMLLSLGRQLEGMKFLERSIYYACKVADYRTLAKSYLRTALFFSAGKEARRAQNNFILAQKALDAIDRSSSAVYKSRRTLHPKLFFEIHRQYSRWLSNVDQLDASKQVLAELQGVMLELERRLAEDLDLEDLGSGMSHSNDDLPAERAVLSPEERISIRQSLMVDYRLFALKVVETLTSASELQTAAERREKNRGQLEILQLHHLWTSHRYRNLVETVRRVASSLEPMGGNATLTKEALNSIVDDILIWSNRDQERFFTVASRPKVESVGELLQVAKAETIEAKSAGKGQVMISLDGDDFRICCNRGLVVQAITNLLENALRLIDERQPVVQIITLRRTVIRDDHDNLYGIVEVEDEIGAFDELKSALSSPGNGLKYVKTIIGFYEGELCAIQRGASTIIQIKFPPSKDVDLVPIRRRVR